MSSATESITGNEPVAGTGTPDQAVEIVTPQETAKAPETRERGGLTIRLKLTLWYGCLFLLAGVALIAVNYFMVRNSLSIAPEKARAEVAERFGIPQSSLEFLGPPGGPGEEMQRYVTINGIPLPRLLDEAQTS